MQGESNEESSGPRQGSTDFCECLHAYLHERAALLTFVRDVLSSLKSLFYDPTPFLQIHDILGPVGCYKSIPSTASAKSLSKNRRSPSKLRPAPVENLRVATIGQNHEQTIGQNHEQDCSDLRALVASLEEEVHEASEKYTA